MQIRNGAKQSDPEGFARGQLLHKIKSIVSKCGNSACQPKRAPSSKKFLERGTAGSMSQVKIRKGEQRRKCKQRNTVDDVRNAIDSIVGEESLLALNSELKQYWVKIVKCARRKNKLAEEVDLIERRRKVLESMNNTNYRPQSRLSRNDNLRTEDCLLKIKDRQQRDIDRDYLALFDYRRTLNSGAPSRKPSQADN